ncbi:hypothetical protein, partial [Escherichia coli]|uniref:hypothetical protein n=1 Tax=Escherichia coli TaxID=562 RepID=UPI001BDBA4AD
DRVGLVDWVVCSWGCKGGWVVVCVDGIEMRAGIVGGGDCVGEGLGVYFFFFFSRRRRNKRWKGEGS